MEPLIAVTMGDPAGIGPEIICRACGAPELAGRCRLLAVGDAGRLQLAGAICGWPGRVRPITGPDEARFEPGTLDCLQVAGVPADLPWGRLDARAGEAAYQAVAAAAALAVHGAVDALCTAPLNKEALHLAGHRYPGHTELLAELTGAEHHAMLLTCPGLRVVHVPTHIGLVDAVARITPERIWEVIQLGEAALRRAGIAQPRIALCGLNPHAGENGLFGHGEERERIEPAVRRARAAGIAVEGPLPADTLFVRAVRGQFDLVVAMYHDQGHIPVKVLGLDAGVNVTLGLPVVRTSVDHGTAFDIAGRGVADHHSMVAALLAAIELCGRD